MARPTWQNRRAILLLFLANTISGIAQGISMLAIPWYFAQREDGATFGYLYAAITACSLIWGPYSGTLVDRYDRRKIFLLLNAVVGSIVLGVALLGQHLGGLAWGWVGCVYLATFLNYNLHYPNLYAFIQEITEQEHYGKITSYIEIQGQMASVLAGACAAMLLEGTSGEGTFLGMGLPWAIEIAPWGIEDVFLLDGMTYLAGFCIIWLIRYRTLVPRKYETGTVWKRLKVGYQFLMEHRHVLYFGVASYSIFACVLVSMFYVNPIYVKSFLDAGGDVFATSEVFYAMGAVFAGIAIRRIFNEKNISIPNSIILMTLAAAALFTALNFSGHLTVYFAMMLILGITNAGTRIQRVTYLFRNIPNQFYGRSGSIFFISNIFLRITFTGLFALPFFHKDANIVYSMGIMGAFLFVSAMVLFSIKK